MEFSNITKDRRSIKAYDPQVTIDDETLATLFDHVALTPSAFNLQHWSFIVARDPERKAAMQEAAFGQPQVGQSSAAILVTAKRNAHEDAPEIFEETPESVQAQMLPMIEGFYAGKEQLQRDEAIRSASMAAMTLMYAAKDLGFDTGPMIGFDTAAMARLLHLPENYIPVMLIVLGKGEPAPRPRAYRRPLAETVHLETFDGAGLGQEFSAKASAVA